MQRKVQCASGGACPNPGRDENNPGRKGSRASSGGTGSHRNRRHPWHKDRRPPEPPGTGRCVQARSCATATLPPSSLGSFGCGMVFGIGSSQCSRGALQRPSCLSFPGDLKRRLQGWRAGKGSALDKRCRERRPLVLPPPHRSPASPPAASFRRRLSRLLSQHETPVTPGGASGRRPSRRGCPAAAQRLPLCPRPWRLISSSPSHRNPPIPPRRVIPAPFPRRPSCSTPCARFLLPLPVATLPTFPAPNCSVPAFLEVPQQDPNTLRGHWGVMPTMCCPRFPLGVVDPWP